MSSRDFIYWLQGFLEISDAKELTEKQTEVVKRHLALVFKHEIDPSYSSDPKVQEELNMIHSGAYPQSLFPNIAQKPNKEGEVYRC